MGRQAGVARVVVGMRHPLPHLNSRAISALQEAGVQVEVVGEGPAAGWDCEVSSGGKG